MGMGRRAPGEDAGRGAAGWRWNGVRGGRAVPVYGSGKTMEMLSSDSEQ